jgi:preprotein translocase subunit SecG
LERIKGRYFSDYLIKFRGSKKIMAKIIFILHKMIFYILLALLLITVALYVASRQSDDNSDNDSNDKKKMTMRVNQKFRMMPGEGFSIQPCPNPPQILQDGTTTCYPPIDVQKCNRHINYDNQTWYTNSKPDAWSEELGVVGRHGNAIAVNKDYVGEDGVAYGQYTCENPGMMVFKNPF